MISGFLVEGDAWWYYLLKKKRILRLVSVLVKDNIIFGQVMVNGLYKCGAQKWSDLKYSFGIYRNMDCTVNKLWKWPL